LNYPPDPGGVFASDTHRRVAGNLPLPDEPPISLEDLLGRVDDDAHTLVPDVDALAQVLAELASSGHAKELKAGWRLSAGGLSTLAGPIANEPPPLEGKALEDAEAANAAMAEEGARIEGERASARVEHAEEELEAAKAAAKEVA
jgi:hypothetical protein